VIKFIVLSSHIYIRMKKEEEEEEWGGKKKYVSEYLLFSTKK
jgi:hypothetical protein